MDNKIKSIEPKDGLKISHRKEDRLDKSYIAISRDGSAIAEMRIYYPATMAYACLWIHFAGLYANGSGSAGGYGYHKQSAAAGQAFEAAGVKLSQDIDGRGDGAIRDAMTALGKKLAGRKFLTIIEAHG